MAFNEPPSTEGIDAAAQAVRERARPLANESTLDSLVEAVRDSRCVMFGEATHGTSEFYRLRAKLTARLLCEENFSFVVVEGDWTDCYDVNRYVKGESDANHARDVLSEFDRWPTWMWANWEVVEFAEWLREHNRDSAENAGFYGLDVYSLFESMAAVVDYLEDVDPEAVERAKDAYKCFEPYGEDAREYGRSTRLVPDDCEDEVVEILAELRDRRPPHDAEDGEAHFSAEQNALVAANAEEYYRTMVQSSADSWNVRDRHMAETLDRLLDHHGSDSKAIVWAHNTHVGDARATTMAERDRLNIGQLARERYGADDVSLVGFGTHHGEVIAGKRWGAPMERMSIPAGHAGSYEDVFHRAGAEDKLLVFSGDGGELAERRGHRAVGVVYDPSHESGNYVPTALSERYDAFVHVDETEALHPLHIEPEGTEEPETYPWGI
ncbi:erythromycin esterase family protein [Haladaptatus halobius]|uniref:erythromycin esterase family protein n=1 Tax=Haladaptatus halobius TaxID=2884875 RepID=UPI001D09D7FF|nr:erythromycin esterase family protein [Haladaptatus halobius]